MGRDLGLADRLRARGLRVIEVDGWRARGSDSFAPRGAVNHHTAGAARGNAPSLGICINGRADLPGPLCHVLLARDLACYVIASGRANHAGKGGYGDLTGNSSVYGLEIENVGTQAEPWRADQKTAAAQVHAAFLEAVAPSKRVLPSQHYEWTTRKIDAHDWAGSELRAATIAALEPGDDDVTPDQWLFIKRMSEKLDELDGALTVLMDRVAGLPRGGLSDYGKEGSDLNDYRVLATERFVQIISDQTIRVLVADAVIGTVDGPFTSDTSTGPNTRVDVTVELKSPVGTTRWFTFDPSRSGFPGADGLPPHAHLVPHGEGWHYVDVDGS